ncbi:2363_t:CDS:1, partial [Racocetra persica]
NEFEIDNELDELSKSENTQILEIYIELIFEIWDHIKKWFDAFALQEGFSYRTRRSESDKALLDDLHLNVLNLANILHKLP